MYYQPPPSQNAYEQNYYSQQNYYSSNYNPNAPNSYNPNGGYRYGPNASSPNIYPNTYGNYQQMQPIRLDNAINKSSYSSTNRDLILDTILDYFSDRQENSVFLQSLSSEKIFFIMKNLVSRLVNKTYKIPLVIYLPQSYPNSPPEFYIYKKPKVGINNHYYKEHNIIDPNSFRIYTDKICAFNPSKNNLDEIIEALKEQFSKTFPIFQEKNNANNQIPPFSPANPDFRKANQVIVESNKMTNKQALNLAKQQTRDIVLKKYQEFKNRYKVSENYYELNTINNIVKLKAGNSSNGNENPLIESLNYLNGIKQKLIEIEKGLNQEIQNFGSQKKTPLEKCDDLIKIKDEEDMRLLTMKKAIEDYLVCLKKGFEKKLVSFQDMVNQTRELSRQMFSIDYLRAQRKNQMNF
jgi:hypothetical protein